MTPSSSPQSERSRRQVFVLVAIFVCLCFAVVALDSHWNQRPVPQVAIREADPVPPLVPRRDLPQPPANLSPMRLNDLGSRLDCYFTVEEFRYDGAQSRLQNTPLPPDFQPSNLADLVEVLAKTLPGFRVAPDPAFPVVIRIVENALLKRKDYALDRSLKATFSGTPYDLLLWLRRRRLLVGGPTFGSIGGDWMSSDHRTALHIRNHDGSVRRLLTEHLPLFYGRVLWMAAASEEGGVLETTVRFPRPSSGRGRLNPSYPYLPDAKDFSLGLPAYVNNAGKKGAVAAAIRCIDEQMSLHPDHPKVRWAMFFLALEKAEIGIPTLIKHLDYRYTPWGVLRESYPAVKALSLLGPAAGEACLEQLRREDVPLRQRLLCQVLLDQQDADCAMEALQAEQARSEDAAQRDRLGAAQKILLELAKE